MDERRILLLRAGRCDATVSVGTARAAALTLLSQWPGRPVAAQGCSDCPGGRSMTLRLLRERHRDQRYSVGFLHRVESAAIAVRHGRKRGESGVG